MKSPQSAARTCHGSSDHTASEIRRLGFCFRLMVEDQATEASAWRKARRPISSAALRTAGLIGRPRRSTELTRTPPRSGCAFSAIGSQLQRRTIPKKAQHQTVRPTIPPKEEEYRLEPKPQLTTIRSIPRAAVKSPDGPSEPVELLVGRYSAKPYVRVARGWNYDRQSQGGYDYYLLWDTNPHSVHTGPG